MSDDGPARLSPAARAALPRLARDAIAAHLAGRRSRPPCDVDDLRQVRGAFVTLRRRDNGELRGCIGVVEPSQPLAETVAEMAVAAATSDPRFPPVRAGEFDELTLDVSVLTPPAPIRPGDVVVGRHGLSLHCAGRRGLLLPQVPEEHGWDRAQFLEALCRKAGLPAGAWQREDARLFGFEAEVVGE